MSKPFDYRKWDKIELSDDEEDCHPNVDKESWFRMKHRSRVEREENESKDKKRIEEEMEKANQRIKILQHDLTKLTTKSKGDDDDSDDDEDLDDVEGLQAELKELQKQIARRQAKLDEYEKNKKLNIDNMFQVKEERTIINPNAGTTSYNAETGFIQPAEDEKSDSKKSDYERKQAATTLKQPATAKPVTASVESKPSNTVKAAAKTTAAHEATEPKPTTAAASGPFEGRSSSGAAIETYHEFTEKYADVVEKFMAIPDLDGTKEFLLRNADIILQENASNYLLLASLEDEMNGYREKMKRTARQSQIVSNLAEMAKTVNTHPGNVIIPFFRRLQQREHLEEFMAGVNAFVDKIIQRAIVKKREMDNAARENASSVATSQGQALEEIPLEQRVGPGGLDPLEVIETLPASLVEAFESRDVDKLKAALMQMDPKDAAYHMKRCVDSGLWVQN